MQQRAAGGLVEEATAGHPPEDVAGPNVEDGWDCERGVPQGRNESQRQGDERVSCGYGRGALGGEAEKNVRRKQNEEQPAVDCESGW